MKNIKSCPKKSKVCRPIAGFKTIKRNYICGGISYKPSKYSKDLIWLCLEGKLSKTSLEMTPEETMAIISCLSRCIFILNTGEKNVKSKM